jgi:hypothetical protein
MLSAVRCAACNSEWRYWSHGRAPTLAAAAVFLAQLGAGAFLRSVQVMRKPFNPRGTLEGFLDEELRTAMEARWGAARLARCFR